MTTGSDHVADLDRVLVPTADPGQHAWTPGFADPFFDLTLIVFHIKGNFHVGIDESEFRHGSFYGHNFRRVIIRLSVMRQERADASRTPKIMAREATKFFIFCAS